MTTTKGPNMTTTTTTTTTGAKLEDHAGRLAADHNSQHHAPARALELADLVAGYRSGRSSAADVLAVAATLNELEELVSRLRQLLAVDVAPYMSTAARLDELNLEAGIARRRMFAEAVADANTAPTFADLDASAAAGYADLARLLG
jgi:hypothetical protein